MKILFVLLLFGVSACSHAPPESERAKAIDAEIAALAKPETEIRLAEIQKRLAHLDERLEVTRARRDSLQLQASTDATKQNAVDGTDAEIASLQQEKAILQHEEHALEARLRDLDRYKLVPESVDEGG